MTNKQVLYIAYLVFLFPFFKFQNSQVGIGLPTIHIYYRVPVF